MSEHTDGLRDRNVDAVREQLLARSRAGIQKYGVTTAREDLSQSMWLVHLQEELLDAAVYIERILSDLEGDRP